MNSIARTQLLFKNNISSNDTSEIIKTLDKIEKYLYENPDSAIYLIDDILKQYLPKDNVLIIGRCYYIKGLALLNKGENSKSNQFYISALKNYIECGDEYLANVARIGIGANYLTIGKYRLSSEYLIGAKKYFDNTDLADEKSRILDKTDSS